jgi:hypothetical protein
MTHCHHSIKDALLCCQRIARWLQLPIDPSHAHSRALTGRECENLLQRPPPPHSLVLVQVVHPLQAPSCPLIASLPVIEQVLLLRVRVFSHATRVDAFDGVRQLLVDELYECTFGG